MAVPTPRSLHGRRQSEDRPGQLPHPRAPRWAGVFLPTPGGQPRPREVTCLSQHHTASLPGNQGPRAHVPSTTQQGRQSRLSQKPRGISLPASKVGTSRRVRVSGVRGPLTPRPGHQSHVRTGWGAPKRTTCCGRALQRFARLRVCSEGATGMHVTVWGFLSLHWAVIRSTGSCSLQLSQTSKILICMKTRPIDTFSGTSLVCAHMWVHM